jgi:hypothetical protein
LINDDNIDDIGIIDNIDNISCQQALGVGQVVITNKRQVINSNTSSGNWLDTILQDLNITKSNDAIVNLQTYSSSNE